VGLLGLLGVAVVFVLFLLGFVFSVLFWFYVCLGCQCFFLLVVGV